MTVAAIAVVGVAFPSALAQTACAQWDVTGTWTINQGSYHPTFTFRQTGTTIDGEATLPEGEWETAGWSAPTNSLAGSLVGGHIDVVVTAPHRDGFLSKGHYVGTVQDDTRIVGTARDDNAPQRPTITWSADGHATCVTAAAPTTTVAEVTTTTAAASPPATFNPYRNGGITQEDLEGINNALGGNGHIDVTNLFDTSDLMTGEALGADASPLEKQVVTELADATLLSQETNPGGEPLFPSLKALLPVLNAMAGNALENGDPTALGRLIHFAIGMDLPS